MMLWVVILLLLVVMVLLLLLLVVMMLLMVMLLLCLLRNLPESTEIPHLSHFWNRLLLPAPVPATAATQGHSECIEVVGNGGLLHDF